MTTPYYYPLFEHMAQNHGLTLTDSEMEGICRAVDAVRLTPEAERVLSQADGVKSKSYGCVCPACGEQIFDGQEIVDTEDGMAHGECVK